MGSDWGLGQWASWAVHGSGHGNWGGACMVGGVLNVVDVGDEGEVVY